MNFTSLILTIFVNFLDVIIFIYYKKTNDGSFFDLKLF